MSLRAVVPGSREEILKAKASGAVFAVKLYPAGTPPVPVPEWPSE
jgi:dihydroorotase